MMNDRKFIYHLCVFVFFVVKLYSLRNSASSAVQKRSQRPVNQIS